MRWVALLVLLPVLAWGQASGPANRSHYLHLYYGGDDKTNTNWSRIDEVVGPVLIGDNPDLNDPSNTLLNIFHYDAPNKRLGLWDAVTPGYTFEVSQTPGNGLLGLALRNLGPNTSNTAFVAQGSGSLSYRTQNLDGTGGWWWGQMAGTNQPWRLGFGNAYPSSYAIQVEQPSNLVTIPNLVLPATINVTTITATTGTITNLSATTIIASTVTTNNLTVTATANITNLNLAGPLTWPGEAVTVFRASKTVVNSSGFGTTVTHGACASTIASGTMTGAVIGDHVTVSINSPSGAGGVAPAQALYIGYIDSANHVHVDVCCIHPSIDCVLADPGAFHVLVERTTP